MQVSVNVDDKAPAGHSLFSIQLQVVELNKLRHAALLQKCITLQIITSKMQHPESKYIFIYSH